MALLHLSARSLVMLGHMMLAWFFSLEIAHRTGERSR
jgi:hypothetical protein